MRSRRYAKRAIDRKRPAPVACVDHGSDPCAITMFELPALEGVREEVDSVGSGDRQRPDALHYYEKKEKKGNVTPDMALDTYIFVRTAPLRHRRFVVKGTRPQ